MKEQLTRTPIEEKLSTSSQQFISQLVHSLPEEPVSMTWRADLNEKLRGQSLAVQWHRRFGLIMGPTVGFALAGVCALALFFRTPTIKNHGNLMSASGTSISRKADTAGFEAGIFEAYRQETASRYIEGPGPDLGSEANRSDIMDAASDDDGSSTDSGSL